MFLAKQLTLPCWDFTKLSLGHLFLHHNPLQLSYSAQKENTQFIWAFPVTLL
jgi:hypothetical protein